MFTTNLKRLLLCSSLVLLFIVAACDTQGSSNTPGNSTTAASASTQPPSQTIATSSSHTGSPGVGPIVILSPTPVPGGNAHSQIVTLPDRVLIINDVSKQAGADASSTAIVLTMTIKNTSAKSIMNEASYFQLISAEGDIFGLQSSAMASFFGTIASKSSRNGTIVFQVPTAAIAGLRLLYRSEVATETVFVSLNV